MPQKKTAEQDSKAVDAESKATSAEGGNAAEASSSTRLTKTTACLPIVYGSIAFYLGKKADEFQTHEWQLFLRGPNNEDLSSVISKVVFQLHASFAQPVRELTQPPFEVTERGWGEFEAQIRIIWRDSSEKPTVLNHGIKLYPLGAVPNVLPTSDDAEPVIAENYDEVVFTEPDETFYRQLMRISAMPKIEASQEKFLTKIFSDEEDVTSLIEAQRFLKDELGKVKERFRVVSEELVVVDQSLTAAQQEAQVETANSKKTKAPASQRKSRPPSQAKKAKT